MTVEATPARLSRCRVVFAGNCPPDLDGNTSGNPPDSARGRGGAGSSAFSKGLRPERASGEGVSMNWHSGLGDAAFRIEGFV